MLKPHHNLLEPRPSDRLRVGERLVDIPLREVSPIGGEGETVRITLKSLGVLLTLVAHLGKPVSREALLEWVWPDTLPTDDVITQAITQLRKALGDDRDHPRYIETLAKQGYRLIAPIEWLVDEMSAETPERPVSATVWAGTSEAGTSETGRDETDPSGTGSVAANRRAWMLPASLLTVAVAAGTGYVLLKGGDESAAAFPPPASGAQIQRITALPEPENRPSLSPDGSMIVYSRNTREDDGSSLMLQTTAALPPRQITESVSRQWDSMPSWSPDGRQIAFVREFERHCAVMLMPAAGGSPREIGECLGGSEHSLSWYPDSKALIGAQRPGSSEKSGLERALYKLPLDTGRWERIRYERATTDEDLAPRVSPDGRWIAFQRNVSLADLWRIPVGGGKPERLTRLRTNLYGAVWTHDGKRLLFARYYDLGARTILSSVEIASGRIADFSPRNGYSGSLMYPSVAASGDLVAFEMEDGHSVMLRMPLADDGPAQRQPLFESSGSSLLPSVAPDGGQVLFVSDRSGDLRLWWAERDEPDSLRSIEGFVPMPRYPAVWHESAQRALAIGLGDRGRGLYEIEPRQGRVTRLPLPGKGDPVHVAYPPDPMRLLVVADRGEGRLGLTLYDRSREPWRALAQIEDVAMAFVDRRNQRVVFARGSAREIWAANLDLGDAHAIDRVANQRRTRLMAASAEGVWVMDQDKRAGCDWSWRLVAAPGADAAPQYCVASRFLTPDPVTFDAEAKVIYSSVAEDAAADIGLLPLSALDETRLAGR